MTLPISIRNDISFRKAVTLTRKSFFNVSASKIWNIHIDDLDMDAENFHEAKETIAVAMLSNVSVMDIINEIHQQSADTILEDMEVTLEFFERCRRAINGN